VYPEFFMSILIAFLSLAVEAKLGYPSALFRLIGHPVTWIVRLIACLDRHLNRATDTDATRRIMGIVALIVIVGLPGAVAWALQWLLGFWVYGFFVIVLLGTTLLAQKSLADHVKAVAGELDRGGVAAGRIAVSKIVGRDPEKLTGPAVCRAAIESLAENFSDGVVAPAFWIGVGGLAGGTAYKAANTADSMIGHLAERHQAFGWAAARFDDLINLPASRLTALLIVAAAVLLPKAHARNAWRAVWRDAKKHRSPNAGWPEAAMAGALGLALAGPRVYGGITVDDAVMGDGGRSEATTADIRRALHLFWIADVLLMALFGVLAFAWLAWW
jgi:adenosylcobinamide-phosphate synthase